MLGLDEEAAGVGDLDEAIGPHLQDSHLVGRPEAVLGGAEQSRGPQPLALEIDDRVDQVLQGTRPRHGALLGNVADQSHAGGAGLGDLCQASGHLADLADAAARTAEIGADHGLHAVDHGQGRSQSLDRPDRRGQVGGGNQADAVNHRANPLCAAPYLR